MTNKNTKKYMSAINRTYLLLGILFVPKLKNICFHSKIRLSGYYRYTYRLRMLNSLHIKPVKTHVKGFSVSFAKPITSFARVLHMMSTNIRIQNALNELCA